MPQQICLECCQQLINSYKFIQQACNVAQYYIGVEYIEEQVEDSYEYLQESFTENCFSQEEIKTNSDIESNDEIKVKIEDR